MPHAAVAATLDKHKTGETSVFGLITTPEKKKSKVLYAIQAYSRYENLRQLKNKEEQGEVDVVIVLR